LDGVGNCELCQGIRQELPQNPLIKPIN